MWQTYDWYLDTNGGFFGSRVGNQPTHAVWDPRNDNILLSNATPREYAKVTTTVTVYDLNGKAVSSRDFVTDTLGPDAYGVILTTADFSASSTDLVFLKLTVKASDGKLLGEDLYWHNRKVYQDYRELGKLAAADLTATVSVKQKAANGNDLYTITVTNSSNIPAVQTRIRTVNHAGEDVLPAFYSDNYFALMPGESKTLTVEFNPRYLDGGTPRFVLGGWNTKGKVID
jgi:hypothetical protein